MSLGWIAIWATKAGIRPFPGLHLIEAVQLQSRDHSIQEKWYSLDIKNKTKCRLWPTQTERRSRPLCWITSNPRTSRRSVALIRHVPYVASCKITGLVQCCGAEGAVGVVGRQAGQYCCNVGQDWCCPPSRWTGRQATLHHTRCMRRRWASRQTVPTGSSVTFWALGPSPKGTWMAVNSASMAKSSGYPVLYYEGVLCQRL